MTKREFVLAAVRLLGIYNVMRAVSALDVVGMFDSPRTVLPSLCFFILKAGFGVLLCICSASLTSAMVSNSSTNPNIGLRTLPERDIFAARLISIFMISAALQPIDALLYNPSLEGKLTLVCPLIIRASFGILLWIFSPFGMFLTTPDIKQHELISYWKPREFVRLGLTIIGLIPLYRFLNLLGYVVASVVQRSMSGGTTLTRAEITQSVFALQIGFIAFLFIFSAHFLSYWVAPRREFVPSQPGETPPDVAE